MKVKINTKQIEIIALLDKDNELLTKESICPKSVLIPVDEEKFDDFFATSLFDFLKHYRNFKIEII
jgi:hypothetical protein